MSLQIRLVVGMGVVAVVLVVASLVVTRTTEAYLIERVDLQLSQVQNPRETPKAGIRFLRAQEDQGLSSVYVGTINDSGSLETLVRPNLGAAPVNPPAVPQALVAVAKTSGRTKPVTVGTGSVASPRYRVVAFVADTSRFTRLQGTTKPVAVVGVPLGGVDAIVKRLIRVELLATALALAILALVAFWVMRLGVRPIKQMTRTATAIAGGELSQRVAGVEAGTEAGELGTALNMMLGRIEDSFDERSRTEARLRRFVADASHELRTPVTTIRGYAELYRSGGLEEPDELAQAMRRTEQEAIRMGALIEDLLLLARIDQGRPMDHQLVDLGVFAVDAASDARAVDPNRPVTVSIEQDVTVVGDEFRLRQVVANLVDNALTHTPPGTPIHLEVHREGDWAMVDVADLGPGMSADVADQVFERFYRGDPARSRNQGGSGLGLAIVRAIVNAHGGTAALRTAPGQGTTVRLALPAASPSPEADPPPADLAESPADDVESPEIEARSDDETQPDVLDKSEVIAS